jgi:hypothetical protein
MAYSEIFIKKGLLIYAVQIFLQFIRITCCKNIAILYVVSLYYRALCITHN